MPKARLRVYLACSLDGFIAGPNDDLSWLHEGADEPAAPEPGAVRFEDFIADVGAMLMGRRTYDVVSSFEGDWPYGDLPVLVATHRELTPLVDTVRAVEGDVQMLTERALEVADGADVYIDGGALVRQAIEADLVDELILTIVPVILGEGVPLFEGIEGRRDFELVAHHRFSERLVQLRYRRSKSELVLGQ